MTLKRRSQIEQVVKSALELPVGERQRYIAETCLADVDLRDQAIALLANTEDPSQAINEGGPKPEDLQHDAHPLPGSSPYAKFVDPAIGRRLGSYKIMREIGRGGMGAVYLARRDDGEFRQRVAIKLIKRGMESAGWIRMSSFVVFETKGRFLRGLTTLISLACLMVEPPRTACHTLLWSTFRVCHFIAIAMKES